MKRKHFFFSFGLVILFLVVMSIWGDKIMLLHPGRFMKSEWDKGSPIEIYSLKGIISGVDEGRGLKIRVNNFDTLLRINGIVPISTNAKQLPYSNLAIGDSIMKLEKNDTFKIIKHDTIYTWKVYSSSIK